VLCKYIISSKCQVTIETGIKLHLQNGFKYVRVQKYETVFKIVLSKMGKVNLEIFSIQLYFIQGTCVENFIEINA
jgi:hypothetical protein